MFKSTELRKKSFSFKKNIVIFAEFTPWMLQVTQLSDCSHTKKETTDLAKF